MHDLGGSVLPRRLLAIATALVAVYVVILTGQRAIDAYHANQEVEATRREVAELRAKNLELQAELSSNQMDVDIERTARDEGLVKPGDHPVILVWPGGARSQPTATATPTPVELPNWREWLSLFVDADANR
ncbi:MAG TPA: septum formation initiator family protein [Chloroflexota bacterium]|nr:septum formation initiator family protein [Chloroflexota bacterium]